MPVEIEPAPKSIALSVPINGFRGRLRPAPSGTVPEGFDAHFAIGGVNYTVHDYRDRPGHTPGARIGVDGDEWDLGPSKDIIEVNGVIFRWRLCGII
ncbi:hypothetical protein HYU89_00900 [Candidatus Collierbacteria bacterium]|nr:hypothetical protein [Candidatus Collierbacteria bacterium]